MTDGMEIQEPSEAPEKISEVSEESKRVDDVTFEPEALIEREMDYETAEAIETAITESVKASITDEVSTTPVTLSKEIGETLSEGEEASITIAKAAESVEEPGAGDVSEQLDGLGDDSRADDGLVMRDPDGSDGSPEIDYGGLENTESSDLSKPTDISDAYGPDGMRGANQGEGVGYLGDMMGDPTGSGIEIPGGDVEIPGMDPHGGGGEMVDPGLPGIDQEGEMAGLAGMAAPGADGRISDGVDDLLHQINLGILGAADPEGAAAAGGGYIKDEASGYPQSDYARMMGLVGKQTAGETLTTDEEQFVNEYAKAVEDQSGGDEGSDGGGDGGSSGDDSTPDPESGETSVYYDPKRDPGRGQPITQGEKEAEKRLVDLMPDPGGNPEDRFNHFDSLTQPVGPEDSVTDAGPPPDLSGELGSGLDPLINWGEEENEGGIVIDDDEVNDPDGGLIDPPEMAGGGEGGIEDTGSGDGFEDIDP